MRRFWLAPLVAWCLTACVAAVARHDVPVSLPFGLPEGLPDPGRNVEVRVVDLSPVGLLGQSKVEGDHFLILLDDDVVLDYQLAYETLIHEWAHLLSWEALDEQGSDHGPAWGIAYAWTYRALLAAQEAGTGGSGGESLPMQ